MIQVQQFECGAQGNLVGQIIMRPNQSMSWQATKYFLILLLALSTTIACGFLVHVYWMILPFSILEVGIVAGCFYYLLHRSSWQQVIKLDPESIHVSQGYRQPELDLSWQRFYTKVHVEQPRKGWYAPKIFLRHAKTSIELGEFLNASEKERLVRYLRDLIHLADQRQTQTSDGTPGTP